MIFWSPIVFQNIISFEGLFLDWLHDCCILIIFYIVLIVGSILYSLLKFKWINKNFIEDSFIEFIWTCLPVVILVILGYNRIQTLYSHELEPVNSLTVKITGQQWYWTYDYTNFRWVEFDSYIKPISDLKLGEFRNLEVDNNIVIPNYRTVRLIISRNDVLHSWAIPRLGLKVDANPGKLNIINIFSNFPGLFYGQCREICGANHRFIPICLESTNFILFKYWLLKF